MRYIFLLVIFLLHSVHASSSRLERYQREEEDVKIEYVQNQLRESIRGGNLRETFARLRLFKKLHHILDLNVLDEDRKAVLARDVRSLQMSLFPSLKLTGPELAQKWRGKGIVIGCATCNKKQILSLVDSLRVDHEIELPIEIASTDFLFGTTQKNALAERNVKLIELRSTFTDAADTDSIQLPALSVLASSFSQAIYMDASLFFFQDPSKLFHDMAFKTSGALFFFGAFQDPKTGEIPRWLRSHLPSISETLQTSPLYNMKTDRMIDHKFFVIDKIRHWNAIIGSTRLVKKPQISQLQKHLNVTENIWLAFEAAGEIYSLHSARIGAIGNGIKFHCHNEVNQLHFDRNLEPLWFSYQLSTDRPENYRVTCGRGKVYQFNDGQTTLLHTYIERISK